jgi:AcrR family transcriptional regulator
MTQRDPHRTRQAILETAERLFARRGFTDTTLQEIGEAAGFARSTPAYFFGTKQALYDAVLARALERGRDAMRPAFHAAATAPSRVEALDAIVGALLDFLAAEPDYVRLMQREALADRPSLPAVLDPEALDEMRDALAAAVGEDDANHVFLELFALAWFPFAHSRSLVAGLGFDAHDAGFLRRHRDRLIRLFA